MHRRYARATGAPFDPRIRGPMIRNQPRTEAVAMNPASRDFALDPQDLARLLVSRANAGDVEGVVTLYEPDAALACGDGRIAVGTAAIRKFYADLLAAGRTSDLGAQRLAMVRENLALTSTRLPDGIVTAEAARKQIDGTWLWVIDQPSISV
jgi:ketosteroid isomerase-like protein